MNKFLLYAICFRTITSKLNLPKFKGVRDGQLGPNDPVNDLRQNQPRKCLIFSISFFMHLATDLWTWSFYSFPWSIWWYDRSLRFYWNRLEVKHLKKCLLYVGDMVFITNILNSVQLTKFTRRKEFSADPMGPKMFPRPNPFRKWLFF